jgi:hypothetical protein
MGLENADKMCNHNKTMSFCQYKNALGTPNAGFHKHVAGVAVGDVIVTLIVVFILVKLFKWDFSLTAGILFLLAFALHKMFCIR